MRINADRIDRTHAASCDGRDRETPVLATWGKQLHRVAGSDAEQVRQFRPDDQRARVVSKIIEQAGRTSKATKTAFSKT